MKNKFIVIDGTDGSGKSIQLELLSKAFNKKGLKIKTVDFPRYDETAWGELAGRMLMGEFGDPANISPYLTTLPYAIDQYFGSLKIQKLLSAGKTVLANRYFTSNVHQVGKLDGKERVKFRKWLWNIGWNELKLTKPDLIIVLFVPVNISMELVNKKTQRNYTKQEGSDLVERDKNYQQKAAEEYKRMCKTEKNWVLLKCTDKKGNLKSKQKIHQEVIRIINKKLKIAF
ncbi:MAG: hypothetical protein ABIH88_01690 [Patescibacteria group bacterium]